MEKDKGCKITKPDKIGEEKIYLLEKELQIYDFKIRTFSRFDFQ